MARHRVASVDEIAVETVKGVLADSQEVCLAHAPDGNFYALDDVCTHENFLLSGGEMVDFDVECPQHGSKFNVKTGAVTGLPAVIPARTFPVTVEGDDVYVDV